MRLAGLDLNLLVVLDALIAESSVTAAAKRLGLSQSATSHALARLRTLLDDPLLERTAQGMVVTPRAAELEMPVRKILDAAGEVLTGGQPFVPGTSRMAVRLGLESAAQLTVLPALVERIRSTAPDVVLTVVPVQADKLVRSLENAEIDFAVTPFAPSGAKGLIVEELVASEYICITRRRRSRKRKTLTLDDFLEADHVTVDYPNLADQEIDELCAARGAQRHIKLTVSTPASIPTIVAGTDLIATIPRALLDVGGEPDGLTRHEPPLELAPALVHLVHHERTQGAAGHEWFLGEVRSLLRDLVGA
ncbi:MAG: LysR family transcriptional regulator [bacterium]|nr:LysR family transcriptional regulator [bacterium]